MIICIYDWGHGSDDDYQYDWQFGLKYSKKRAILSTYEVIDEKLFMLAVVKLGIQFTELKDD